MESLESTPKPTALPAKPACTLCKERKVRCDRNSPCSNCLKLALPCIPRTNSKTRTRRRPNADLQARLARCEELLQQFSETEPAKSTVTPPASHGARKPGADQTPGPQLLEAGLGRLVLEDGSVRFTDSILWATISEELRSMRAIVEADTSTFGLQDSPLQTLPSLNSGSLLIGGDAENPSVQSLHPAPSQVVLLWQMFLDRVNPLTKLVHVPSVQPHLVQATTTPPHLPLNLKALFFAIYGAAVNSMDDEECIRLLGCPQRTLYHRFSLALRMTLRRAQFLEAPDFIILQALTLHLLSLNTRNHNVHATWVLSGVCIRIAQKIGLHRDGEFLGLPPYETEMRRRVWWHIVLLDFQSALASGFSPVPLPVPCDCKSPTNINDADFGVATVDPLQNHDGPTEMILCLLICSLIQCLIDRPGIGGIVSSIEANNVSAQAGDHERIAELNNFAALVEHRLNDIIMRYCDPAAGHSHAAALQIRSAITVKIRTMARAPDNSHGPEKGRNREVGGDNLFRLSVEAAEHSAGLFQSLGSKGFLWFVAGLFEQQLFLYLVGQLCHRTAGALVEKAWEVIPVIYQYNHYLNDLSHEPNGTLAAFLMKAWKTRQQALLLRLGYWLETPDYILKVEQALTLRRTGTSSLPLPAPTSTETLVTASLEPENSQWEPLCLDFFEMEQSWGLPEWQDLTNWSY